MNPLLDVKHWREEVGRNLLNLDFRPEGDQPFRYQLKPIVVTESVRVVRSEHGPGYTFRDRELLRDGNGCLAIVFPLRGSLSFSQEGGGVLRGNGAKLLVCDRPGQLGGNSPCNYVSIIFQPGDLPRGADIAQLAKSPWLGTAPALRLLRSYIDTLNDTMIPPASELADVTHRHILDLVRLAANERSQVANAEFDASSTVADARVRIAQEDIAKYFRECDLTQAAIAARQGISARHLQRIFEVAGIRFTDEVNALRLEAAYQTLSNSLFAALTVTEIALSAGFSDVSHFNRLFRRRFGATPSEVRMKQDRLS